MPGLIPWAFAQSAYRIDYEKLRRSGVRGLIFDIDYTLVAHNAPAAGKTLKMFAYLKRMGFRCVFLSNNGERRAAWFNERIGIDVVTGAMKPLPYGFRKALRVLDLPAAAVVSVGDQIFTDILGSNLAGIRSILVGRMDKEREWHLVLKALLEKLILAVIRKTGKERRIDR